MVRSAGGARSKKILLKQQAKAKYRFRFSGLINAFQVLKHPHHYRQSGGRTSWSYLPEPRKQSRRETPEINSERIPQSQSGSNAEL
jgi:hypothetical protein